MTSDEKMEEFRRRTSLVNILRWSIPGVALLTLPATFWLQRGITAAAGLTNPWASVSWEVFLSALLVLSALTTWSSWTAMMRCVDFDEPGLLSAIITFVNAIAFFIGIILMLTCGFALAS